ncbi:MAG TPA: FtsX-like permease family protein [Ktedonobacteraceae bacterium]|nr:FtsX-like permease family protein [Ktedonobacteraceae bacterium]
MKASMYFNYTSRSLLRGGQRTILAVFCVTVGVMAVVALQLVGFMLQNSISTNAREANGGDITVIAQGAPLKSSDLTFFDRLKNNGTITNYTAIASTSASLNNESSSAQFFTVDAVDPGNFPIVSQPAFVSPGNGTVGQLLTNNQVIVSQNFLSTYHKQLNDSFSVYVKTALGTGETLQVKIAGVIENTGMFAQSGNLLLISSHDYLASAPATLANYSLVDITTTDQAHTNTAVNAINNQFSLVSTQTATDVLKSEQSSIDMISTFLKISGLLALLIGGVGIINTMQVVLSRRKTEIAMLKTAGYHRKDLYLLFGMEAGLLGLIGGIFGAAAAIGVSYLIRGLLENFGTNVPFVLNSGMIVGGVVVGFATALIFGLLPIVQATNIRPLSMLRGLDNKSLSGRVLTILLLALFSILFCLLAIVILNNNVMLGVVVTYSTFAFLLLLSGIFGLIVLAISKLPVPEHVHFTHVLLVLPGITISVLVYLYLPVFGIFLLAVSLMGIVVALLPGHWKVNVKMALRNLGRRRVRTMATMLALFIGVYGIGIDIGMGQDLGVQITSALNQNSPYNIVATTVGKDSNTLRTHLNSIPGVTASREDPFTNTLPVAINGRPSQQSMPGGANRQQALSMVSGIEGYDLTRTLPAQKITVGRNLNASDANTNNVIVSQIMTSKGWAGMNLKPGDTMTYSSLDGKVTRTVTIVGIISVPGSFETLGKVIAPISIVNALDTAATGHTTVFYMKVGPDQLNSALNALNRIAPNASVQNLSDAAVSFLQFVNSFMDMILAIAALSMIAAMIIIANSVALAMLERRRELGILKSVGYTSRTILSQVMIENGITGGVGAFIATLLAAGGVTLGSKIFFNNSLTLNMEPVVIVSMVIGPALLAILTAVLVAWNAVRVRPLEVLRYE